MKSIDDWKKYGSKWVLIDKRTGKVIARSNYIFVLTDKIDKLVLEEGKGTFRDYEIK